MKKVVSMVACAAVVVMVAGIAMAGEGKKHKGEDWFTKADTDKDGKLSVAEFKAAHPNDVNAEAKFQKADTDKDGFLTKEELKAARKCKKADKSCAAAKPADAPVAPVAPVAPATK